MTASEAFLKIEDELTALNILTKLGEPCPGLTVMGLIGRFIPHEWEVLTARFRRNETTPDEYFSEARSAIRKFQTRLTQIKAVRRIEELRSDQIERELRGVS